MIDKVYLKNAIYKYWCFQYLKKKDLRQVISNNTHLIAPFLISLKGTIIIRFDFLLIIEIVFNCNALISCLLWYNIPFCQRVSDCK